MDLPCIIEAQKSLDHKQFYKVADISQILVAEDVLPSAELEPVNLDDYMCSDGLTPPLRDVRNRRFRKRVNRRAIEDVEREINRLLEEDSYAEIINYTFLDEAEANERDGDERYFNEAEEDEEDGEEEGEEGEEGDGEVDMVDVEEDEEELDDDFLADLEGAIDAGVVKGGVKPVKGEAVQGGDGEEEEEEEDEEEDKSSDEDDEEDDEGEGEDGEEEDSEEVQAIKQQRKIIEDELRELIEKAESLEKRIKVMAHNPTLVNRTRESLANVNKEITRKKSDLSELEKKLEP